MRCLKIASDQEKYKHIPSNHCFPALPEVPPNAMRQEKEGKGTDWEGRNPTIVLKDTFSDWGTKQVPLGITECKERGHGPNLVRPGLCPATACSHEKNGRQGTQNRAADTSQVAETSRKLLSATVRVCRAALSGDTHSFWEVLYFILSQLGAEERE